MIPIDHGTSMGPLPGLEDVAALARAVAEGGANALALHKGLVRFAGPELGTRLACVIHLSASTSLAPKPNLKVPVGEVREAIALGADAISIHVNIGGEDEERMLADFGAVATACNEFGFPLLAMTYPRGQNIKNAFDVEAVKHCARLSAELGADLVKTNYTGSPESFREVVRGCPIPVLIAGGPKIDSDRKLLEMIEGAVQAGAGGVSIGRNVFQHRDVEGITRAIAQIVFEGKSAESVYRW